MRNSSTAPAAIVTAGVSSRTSSVGGITRARLEGSARNAKTSDRGRASHKRDSMT